VADRAGGEAAGLVASLHSAVPGTDVRYDEETALIVVDLQNDFADPAGSLYVRGGEAVVPVANAHIGAAHDAGALVVYTQDWHPPSTPHFEKDGGLWPVHCVQDTWGAAFHPDLRVEGDIVRKGSRGEDGYSAFSVRDARSGATAPTILQGLLEGHDVATLVVCGLATDFCVVETVTDARDLGYPVSVLHEGIRAVDRKVGAGERALRRMRDAGARVT
jgi:nicotinamidase/pyrazinamidase